MSQSGQQPPSQALISQPPLLRPLHTLITACLEIPTAASAANPVDVALYEALADALAPAGGRIPAEEKSHGAADAEVFCRAVAIPSSGGDGVMQTQLLHLVLGTYIRRYLCRQVCPI